MATGTSIAIDDLGYTHSTPQHALGQSVELDDGNKYRYIYNESTNVTITQYQIAINSDATSWDFNCITATVATAGGKFAGVACTDIGGNEYGWACYQGVTLASCATIATAGFGLAVGAGVFAACTLTNVYRPAHAVYSAAAGNMLVRLGN